MAKVIGLTGGIACGKSTVSTYLREKEIPVIDADLVARQVVEPGTAGLEQIKRVFGWQYICPDGSLNRALLGKKVFTDPAALTKLNQIMGPLITAELKKQLQMEAPVIVLDAPLLLEDEKYRKLVDLVWVVTLAPELQLERLMGRNHLSEQQAKARIQAQMSDQERLQYADGVIDNNGTVEQTWQQVNRLLEQSLSN